jgi:hypothetical protein
MVTETLVGGAITVGIGVAAWAINLGSLVSKLEAYREEDVRRLDEIKDGVEDIRSALLGRRK